MKYTKSRLDSKPYYSIRLSGANVVYVQGFYSTNERSVFVLSNYSDDIFKIRTIKSAYKLMVCVSMFYLSEWYSKIEILRHRDQHSWPRVVVVKSITKQGLK